MRLRNVKNALDKLESSNYYIRKPLEYRGKWSSLFNDNPIHLEIGCGKGQFLINMALAHPNINFIGIEKYESVLVRAIEKANKLDINNLKFICVDALLVKDIFNHEIDTMYLNFSDPWPKSRHAKRRLSSPIFLDVYDSIFVNANHIIQKTDNIGLFAYSLEEFSKHGYIINKVCLDLENSDIPNIKTEYEERFSKDGYKINYVEVIKG